MPTSSVPNRNGPTFKMSASKRQRSYSSASLSIMPLVAKRNQGARRTPLYVDLLNDADISRGVKRSTTPAHDDEHTKDDCLEGSATVVSHTLSSKILRLADEQQEDDDDLVENHPINDTKLSDETDLVVTADGFVDFEDERYDDDAEAFMIDNKPLNRETTSTLADMILAKLKEAESLGQKKTCSEELDPRVVKIYQEIGAFLSKYRSGRLPKAFKIIPNLVNWEEVLYLAKPLEWTPNAMHEAIRIFSSNLNPRMAQRFYNLVLLPAVREDIQVHKKLNFHYYQALKFAFYKPSAWFQGILFPLLMDECSLREAVIFGSVLGKISIPPLHVAAALVRLCNLHKGNTLQWSIATTYVINVLLNKKCALPRTAIDAAVRHFGTFLKDTRRLPVLWHRCLLTLVQRYKFDFTPEHKTVLRGVLHVHQHHLVTPEIRRELQHAESMKWTLQRTDP